MRAIRGQSEGDQGAIQLRPQEHLPARRSIVLFQDHLKSQKMPEYISKLQLCKAYACYGPRGRTECWQPIDAGHLGACLKSIAKEEWQIWLDKSTLDPRGALTNF